jgi:hypothetical protein
MFKDCPSQAGKTDFMDARTVINLSQHCLESRCHRLQLLRRVD